MSEERAGDMSLGLEVSKGIVAKLIQAVLGFAGTIIFARILGPTDFGGYYLVLSLVGVIDRPVAGVSSASHKRFAESGAPRHEIFGAQLAFNTLYVVLVGCAALLFHSALRSYTGLEDAWIFFIVLLATITVFSSTQGFLWSMGKIGIGTWIDTLRSVLTTGLQLGLLAAGWAVAGMAYGLAGATALVLPITYYYLRTIPTLPSRETIRSIWEFGKYSVPANFVGKAYDRFDILLLGFIAAPTAAGLYESAYKITMPAMFISGLAGSGLMVKISDLASRGEPISEDITNTLAFVSNLAIPIFFGALAMPSSIIVTAYGSEFKTAAWLLVGLALYRVIQTQTDALVGILNGLDRPDIQMQVSAITLVCNLILGVGLFYLMGPLGVVLATVIAESIRYTIFYRKVSAEVSAILLPRAFFEQVGAGVVMFAVIELLHRVFSLSGKWGVLFLVPLGGVVYYVALTAISSHFRVMIAGVLSDLNTEYSVSERI